MSKRTEVLTDKALVQRAKRRVKSTPAFAVGLVVVVFFVLVDLLAFLHWITSHGSSQVGPLAVSASSTSLVILLVVYNRRVTAEYNLEYRARSGELCPNCRYDVSCLDELVCPECGAECRRDVMRLDR